MNLEAKTVLVDQLSLACISQMQELMQAHYEGVSSERFLADLSKKNWVILLYHEAQLCGFSTQVLFDHVLEGRSVKVLFSGDTIIDKKYWGSMALPVAWGRLMMSLCAEYPGSELYWLLTSKGYKTYRFLPVFFREFHPCFNKQAQSFETKLLESLARAQFGHRFDPSAGVLRAECNAQRLKGGVADILDSRLHDPHIAFFQKKNPNHAKGDELVCLARFCKENLNSYILRQL